MRTHNPGLDWAGTQLSEEILLLAGWVPLLHVLLLADAEGGEGGVGGEAGPAPPGVEVGLPAPHPHHHLQQVGRQAAHLSLQPLPEPGEERVPARQHNVPAPQKTFFFYHEIKVANWSGAKYGYGFRAGSLVRIPYRIREAFYGTGAEADVPTRIHGSGFAAENIGQK